MELTGESVFPGLDVGLKASLNVFSLEGEGSNLVVVGNKANGADVAVELFEFVFEVFELWVVLVENLEGVFRLAVPQPGVFSEGVEEFADIVLSALDGSSQQENDLNDFLVLGNPVVEGLTLILGLVFLVPVLNLLGRFQNVGSGTVDGGLNLLEGRLQSAVSFNKVDIDLEEGLEDLLGGVTATADTFLHLVERVLGSVEEGLVHAPVVVLGQFLDFLGADGLDVLVELIRADSLNKVLNGTLNFVVLALKLLRLNSDPLLLHLDELVERVGS